MKFGIISGAGPMAGNLLYEKVIEKLQKKGASRDYEFPEIILYNYPFSEMLEGDISASPVKDELISSLNAINKLTDYNYIACQTLHGFLDDDELRKLKVVSLLDLVNCSIGECRESIGIVASRTSKDFNLHPKYLNFPCEYIEQEKSISAIDSILSGQTPDLSWLEQLSTAKKILLGCTEFSVALKNSKYDFIDPIELAANDIVQKFTA